MSLKDSIIRGLTMYGVSSMAQSGMGNAKVLRDIINDVEKNAR